MDRHARYLYGIDREIARGVHPHASAVREHGGLSASRSYRKGFFTDIAKLLGMQDVQVGHEPFDSDFVIKGRDEGMLRALFANPKIRELIAQQKDIHFTVKDDEGWFGATFPEGVDELYFAVIGVIKDVERLKLLYELFSETLDQLCVIGSAQKTDPGVSM